MISNRNPIWLIQATIFGETLLLPLVAKSSKTMRPPSSAGNGKRFTTDKFIEISAINERSGPIPSEYAVPANLAIPTGPESSEIALPPVPTKSPWMSPQSETIIMIN